MALINCPECNHLMSEIASVCPNCNKPRDSGVQKKCIHCGKDMEPRKRKCSSCNNFQTTINNSKNMATTTSKGSTNVFALALLFILGATIMFFVYPYFITQQVNKPVNYKKEDAIVNKINDLYVYVEAAPKDKDSYNVVGSVEGDNIIEMVNSIGIGKEKAGQVLENLLNLTKQNINFHEQLLTITEKVKEQYPDAQGVIFSNRIKKCEVIVFNN